MRVKLGHRRAEAFAGSVQGDQCHARPPDIGAGLDLASDARQTTFRFTHDEDLVGASRPSRPVAAFGEERDGQVQYLRGRQAADRLFLVGGPLQLFVEGVGWRWGCGLCHVRIQSVWDSPGARMTTAVPGEVLPTAARKVSGSCLMGGNVL